MTWEMIHLKFSALKESRWYEYLVRFVLEGLATCLGRRRVTTPLEQHSVAPASLHSPLWYGCQRRHYRFESLCFWHCRRGS